MRFLGYTLIELLVAVSIMAIIGVIAFINYRDFASDQILKKAQGQIQTFLRLAQSNATASVLCNGSGGVPWSVYFEGDGATLDIKCGANPSLQTLQKSLSLEKAKVSIQCSPPISPVCPPPSGSTFAPPLTVTFSPLAGNMTLLADNDTCAANSNTLLIVLQNQQNINSCQFFTISKGGSIDAN